MHRMLPMSARGCLGVAAVLASLLPCFSARASAASSRLTVTGSEAISYRDVQALGRTDPQAVVRVLIALPLRHRDQLNALMNRLYDENDPMFHQWLTPEQFTAKFGPDPADDAAVANWARSQGLFVDSVSENRTLVRILGTASTLESAFGVHLHDYIDPQGRTFHQPDRDPSLPVDIAARVSAIVGLNNRNTVHTDMHMAAPTNLQAYSLDGGSPEMISDLGIDNFKTPFAPGYVTGIQGFVAPQDIKSIYGMKAIGLDGSGQVLGLFEVGGYTASDISSYETFYGLPATPQAYVNVDGANDAINNNFVGEVTLDVEMMCALAPGASDILVYDNDDTNFPTSWVDTFTKIATDDRAKSVSTSYAVGPADYDTTSIDDAEEPAFAEMTTDGQSMFVAAGDAGAYGGQGSGITTPAVLDPASQQDVTAVGGTNLKDTSTFGYSSETSWADKADKGRGSIGTGGGGGISGVWSIPSYQVGSFSTTVNKQGSTTMRNIPDVSLFGDYDTGDYSMYEGGFTGANGTSAAAPLWAAYMALVNEQLATDGKATIGLANIPIYAIGENATKYAKDFHDIKNGSTNLFYKAVAGYDNSTGWGSMKGGPLFYDLAGLTITAPQIASLKFSPNPVALSAATTGTLTLNKLTSNSTTSVPITLNGSTIATVTFAKGVKTGTFSYTAGSSVGVDEISAALNDSGVTSDLTVGPTVKSISWSPSTIASGGTTTLTITLTSAAPAGGASVDIETTGEDFIHETVPAGKATAGFSLKITGGAGTYFFTGTYNGTSVATSLTIS